MQNQWKDLHPVREFLNGTRSTVILRATPVTAWKRDRLGDLQPDDDHADDMVIGAWRGDVEKWNERAETPNLSKQEQLDGIHEDLDRLREIGDLPDDFDVTLDVSQMENPDGSQRETNHLTPIIHVPKNPDPDQVRLARNRIGTIAEGWTLAGRKLGDNQLYPAEPVIKEKEA